jgi:hypothetical protein
VPFESIAARWSNSGVTVEERMKICYLTKQDYERRVDDEAGTSPGEKEAGPARPAGVKA